MKLPEFLYESSPGEIRLTGHRIGLYTVVRLRNEGRSAEGIVDELPTLSLEHVRKVLAFAEKNREEVDRYVEEYRRELERQEAIYSRPEFWAELRERYEQMRRDQTQTPLKD